MNIMTRTLLVSFVMLATCGTPRYPTTLLRDTYEMKMVKAGVGVIGSPNTVENCRCGCLQEVEVAVESYSIGVAEVTWNQYKMCADDGACSPIDLKACLERQKWQLDARVTDTVRGNWPVFCVTKDEAEKFCEWVGGELPTEVEWEYAARCAGREMCTKWPWGDEETKISAECDGWWSTDGTVTVGGKCGPNPVKENNNTATPMGIYGFWDNVSEFLADAPAGSRDNLKECRKLSVQGAPQPQQGEYRSVVIKGCAWGDPDRQKLQDSGVLRRSNLVFPTDHRPVLVGFRCVKRLGSNTLKSSRYLQEKQARGG